MTHSVHFLGGQGLLQICDGMSGSLADVHRGKSELLMVGSATMTCGGLRRVSLLCKWVA